MGAVLLLAYLLANSLSRFSLSHLLEGFVSDLLLLISRKRPQSVKPWLASQASPMPGAALGDVSSPNGAPWMEHSSAL